MELQPIPEIRSLDIQFTELFPRRLCPKPRRDIRTRRSNQQLCKNILNVAVAESFSLQECHAGNIPRPKGGTTTGVAYQDKDSDEE